MASVTTLAAIAKDYRLAEQRTDIARAVLYKAIRGANAGGMSFGAIAAETGLSRARVHQVCTPKVDRPHREDA